MGRRTSSQYSIESEFIRILPTMMRRSCIATWGTRPVEEAPTARDVLDLALGKVETVEEGQVEELPAELGVPALVAADVVELFVTTRDVGVAIYKVNVLVMPEDVLVEPGQLSLN